VSAATFALLAVRALASCGGRTTLEQSLSTGLPPEAGSDAPMDAPPSLDVSQPDIAMPGCEDAGATQIYLLSSDNVLYAFYPPTLAISALGSIMCGDPSSPYSMAVDRQGTAYVVLQDNSLFQVSTATSACAPTPSNPTLANFGGPYGMGFVGNPSDGGETLVVAAQMPGELGAIDTTTFALNVIGPLEPTNADLTGTGDGRLYAFWSPNGVGNVGAAISQIDPVTAHLLATTPLPTVTQGSAWAIAFWGGGFYLFTAPPGISGSQVTRFDPADNSVTVVLTLSETIVGAGVSTCAPM
jgi:hypothetical protein